MPLNSSNTFNAIHGLTKNLGDISKVNEEDLIENQFDLITYSFPCTDISQAGKQEGLKKGSQTRSSLLWEVEKFIKKIKPKYLLMENVKALVGEKFKDYFVEWLRLLDTYGYDNYWQVLNAKDYGIPQNRERIFAVSIRKDLQQGYVFPQKQRLKTKLQDLLDDNVEEKFPFKISVDTDDHEINYVMLQRNNYIIQLMRTVFEKGFFRFKNIQCKDVIIKILSYK